MNSITVKVDKILSYQTLTYKNGRNSFRKPQYKAYIQEISLQIGNLTPIRKCAPISLKLTFNCKNKTVGDIDNITKPIQDILQLCGKINDDKYIYKLEVSKTFGHEKNNTRSI